MKVKYDEPLSNVAFKFHLRRYIKGEHRGVAGRLEGVDTAKFRADVCLREGAAKVGRYRLTGSKPMLKLVRAYGFSA